MSLWNFLWYSHQSMEEHVYNCRNVWLEETLKASVMYNKMVRMCNDPAPVVNTTLKQYLILRILYSIMILIKIGNKKRKLRSQIWMKSLVIKHCLFKNSRYTRFWVRHGVSISFNYLFMSFFWNLWHRLLGPRENSLGMFVWSFLSRKGSGFNILIWLRDIRLPVACDLFHFELKLQSAFLIFWGSIYLPEGHSSFRAGLFLSSPKLHLYCGLSPY